MKRTNEKFLTVALLPFLAACAGPKVTPLDLALDALKGEITGLKAERIEALRGMA